MIDWPERYLPVERFVIGKAVLRRRDQQEVLARFSDQLCCSRCVVVLPCLTSPSAEERVGERRNRPDLREVNETGRNQALFGRRPGCCRAASRFTRLLMEIYLRPKLHRRPGSPLGSRIEPASATAWGATAVIEWSMRQHRVRPNPFLPYPSLPSPT